MKYLAVILVCMSMTYVMGQISKEHALSVAAECKSESGATDADIQDIFDLKPSATKEAKCLRACMMKKAGGLDKNNKLLVEPSLEYVKVIAAGNADQIAKGTEVIKTCAAAKAPGDVCEAAEQHNQCIRKEAQAKGFELKV